MKQMFTARSHASLVPPKRDSNWRLRLITDQCKVETGLEAALGLDSPLSFREGRGSRCSVAQPVLSQSPGSGQEGGRGLTSSDWATGL